MINKGLLISENEKTNIISKYYNNNVKRDYIFELCSTVDGRYIIVKDDVFDFKTQTNLGNLWETIDVFKTIFKNVKVDTDSSEYQTIKENILSIPLLESNDSLKYIKSFLLEWSFWDDTWLGSNLKKDAESVKDTFIQGWEGLKQFGINLPQTDWKDILTQLFKGVKWVVRKLKNALYSNTGMIVDGILVATGIGKGAQMVAWGLVVALDIYQIATGDFPEEEIDSPWWWKYLELGLDVLSFTFTGSVGKIAKNSLEPIKNMKPALIPKFINKSPKLKNILENISSKLKEVPSLLNKIKNMISKKFPKGGQFIDDALSKFGKIIAKFQNILNKFLNSERKELIKKGIKGGASSAGILYGFEKAIDAYDRYKQPELTPIQKQNLALLDKYLKDNPL